MRIPPYTPELNPCEQIWQYIKNRYKNKRFDSIEELKDWLHKTVVEMSKETIMSITANKTYKQYFLAYF